MTPIFGMFRLRGPLLCQNDFESLSSGMACIPSNGQVAWQEGQVWLGCVGVEGVAVPAADGLCIEKNAGYSMVCVADARIDNREELCAQLGMRGCVQGAISSAKLILCCYEKWGEKFTDRLLGDFSFAIWDGRRESLICARDHLGIKPFFYFFDSNTFVFSSEIKAVSNYHQAPQGLSDEAVAQFLRTGDLIGPRLTFREAIKKLPYATSLKVGEQGLQESAYWFPEELPALQFESDEQYIELIRDTLAAAVDCRTAVDGSTGVHLSGGLDSSAISALVAKSRLSPDEKAFTFSWHQPPQLDQRELPEWSVSMEVARQCRSTHLFTEFDADKLYDAIVGTNLADHDTVDVWYEREVRRMARANGVTSILTGWGGDQFITNHGAEHYSYAFWHGHPFSALIDLYRAAAGSRPRISGFLSLINGHLISPVYTRMKSTLERRQETFSFLGLASPEFRSYAESLELPDMPSEARSVHGEQLAHLRAGFIQSRLESWAVSGQRCGIEYRYPLLDKRLVELALQLPPHLYMKRGISRYGFRYAVRDLVPRDVWAGNLKLEQQRVIELAGFALNALKRWRDQGMTCESQYINSEQLDLLIDRLLCGGVNMERDFVMQLSTALKSLQILRAA